MLNFTPFDEDAIDLRQLRAAKAEAGSSYSDVLAG